MNEVLILFIVALACTPAADGFIANNIFQTGDQRLYDQFCVSGAKELADIGQNTVPQHEIIKDAVKRSVAKFLAERHKKEEILKPEKLSLSALYQNFLGSCAAPEKFIKAVNDLIESAAQLYSLDGVKDDPTFHFDAEKIVEGHKKLVERLGQTVISIKTEAKLPAARALLGRNLHSISGRFCYHFHIIVL